MGCVGSKTKEDVQLNTVESFLQEERLKQLTRFKLLLLGAGESGKSTVVKQLKVIHKVEMDPQELHNYKVSLHCNTIQMMQVFIENALKFGFKFEPEEEKFVKNVSEFSFDNDKKLMDEELGESIAKLWKSNIIKQTYDRRYEFWHLDSSDYYFDNVERFAESDFKPTEDDCIMARVRTTGIVVTEFDEGPIHFSVVDVAGQRSERKKWIHCFDDVKAVVFVVSLAGFNQVMFEDANHNRMHEELNLFQQIVNNPVFSSTPIFLFLNKKDLFEKMIQDGQDLRKCFPEYTGGNDPQVALKFIHQEFEKRIEGDKNRLHVHYIAARFRKDVRYTWEEVKNKLIEENKKDVKEAAKLSRSRDRSSSKSIKK